MSEFENAARLTSSSTRLLPFLFSFLFSLFLYLSKQNEKKTQKDGLFEIVYRTHLNMHINLPSRICTGKIHLYAKDVRLVWAKLEDFHLFKH